MSYLLIGIYGLILYLLYLLYFNIREGPPTRERTLKELKKVVEDRQLQSKWIRIKESCIDSSKWIQIHYIRNASNEYSRLVIYFLHGTRGYSWGYRELIQQFKDHRCIALDLPGYGISETPSWHNKEGPVVYKEMGQLLARCIAAITPNEKVVFVGHSFGSFLLTSLIQESPELIERVILCSSPGLFPSLGKYSWYYANAFLYNIPFGWYSHDIGSFLWFRWLYQKYDRFTAYFMTQEYSREVNYVGLFIRNENDRLMWYYPQTESIIKSNIPITLVNGEYDSIIPVDQSKMISRICPSIRTYIIKGEGHFCQKNVKAMESIIRREVSSDKKEYKVSEELVSFIKELNHPRRLMHYGSCMSFDQSEKRLKDYFELLLEHSNHVLDRVEVELDIIRYESFITFDK